LQAYQLATLQLDAALKDKAWTASIEQAAEPVTTWQNLPPAIVLDIDETVLDNSPLQARLVQKGIDFDGVEWAQWVHEASAKPVPGAVEFVRYARSKNIRVIYLSNRSRSQEPPTQRNLVHVGLLPHNKNDDAVLSRFEKLSWRDDKSSRRRYIAEKHRIIMLVGDDFNDFVTGAKSSLEQRARLMKQHEKMWGKKWIVIPNPLYGSWEGSVLSFKYDHTDGQKLHRKFEALETMEKGEAAAAKAP
jgi:acid phosphatase